MRIVGAILLAAALMTPGGAQASAFRCTDNADVAVSVQARNSPRGGIGPSCGAELQCFSACVFALRVDISGYGIVGAEATGPFETLHCGPAPLHCSAQSAPFDLSAPGGTAICSSAITVAVRVQLICTPTQIL